MPQIICVSPHPWGQGPNRVGNLVRWLPQAEVLFFEPAQSRLSSLRRPREGGRVAKQVLAFTLPTGVPANEEAPARIARRSRQNAAFIRQCMAEHDFDRPVLWLRCPDQVELAFLLPECGGLIYDCDQDWSRLPPEWEATLAGEADVVFAASEQLQEHLSQYSDNVALLPNGVDYPLFSQAAASYPTVPADLSRIPQPVFGYLGRVDDFTQLGPAYQAAAAHPEWSFVFVGPFSRQNPGCSAMRRQKNVFLLGEKSLPSLPRYLAGFDVCFTLLDERDPAPPLASEQLYQYLASGKPTVTMLSGDSEPFYGDVVYTAHFDIEFISACALALEEDGDAFARRRTAYAAAADWRLRGDYLEQMFDANGF
ncbi:MAG: hypothetical protein LUG44_00405 [Clostridiales bacterium]|nr:hypothetical protein [Clostridiales bacterium]